MFLDANQKKTKGPNKLFEICNRPVFEESKERYKSFIKYISSLLLKTYCSFLLSLMTNVCCCSRSGFTNPTVTGTIRKA